MCSERILHVSALVALCSLNLMTLSSASVSVNIGIGVSYCDQTRSIVSEASPTPCNNNNYIHSLPKRRDITRVDEYEL